MIPYIKYPVLQVRPYGLLVYERVEWMIGGKKKGLTAKEKDQRQERGGNKEKKVPSNKVYTGLMTKYSIKRLKRAINLLIAIAADKEVKNPTTGKYYKFKINFITLTLSAPQGDYTDRQIKNLLLDPFIKRAKRRFKLSNYVWRAERQKNGNIHFHLISDVYMHHTELKEMWNEIQNRIGLIDQFERKHGHRNPNSTDVHAVNNIKDLAAYLVKYMTKAKAQDEIIKGKLWDCSTNLKVKGNCELLLEGEAQKVWEAAYSSPLTQVRHSEQCTIVFVKKEVWEVTITGEVAQRWKDYLAMIRERGKADARESEAQIKKQTFESEAPF